MSKLTLGQKTDRVLRFLMGMRNARIATAMATRGFGHEDVEEGWTLLRNVARGKFDYAAASSADPTVISELDQWENTWFPVVEATLRRRYPALAAQVFLNLSQTEGAGVILTVGTLVERIDALMQAADDESKDAVVLLGRRGLTSAVLDEARELLESVGEVAPSAPVDLDAHRQDIERAETELWDWYLEWSQIARATITQRQLLRALGFLSSSRTTSSSDDAVDDEPDVEPVANTQSGFAPPLASQVSAKTG
jgi:hypothetical protein